MSEVEHHKGKLIPTGKSVIQYMEGKPVPRYINVEDPEDVLEWFRDESYRTAVEIEGQVFTVESEKIDPYDDIMRASKNDDGGYNFEVKYYNGGCSFDEAIEQAVSKV